MISCKANNNRLIESQERLVKTQENQVEGNAVIIHSLSNLQRQEHLRINHGQEERTNEEYDIRSQS